MAFTFKSMKTFSARPLTYKQPVEAITKPVFNREPRVGRDLRVESELALRSFMRSRAAIYDLKSHHAS
jgi:hypothetical protein